MVRQVELQHILPLRELFLSENRFQIRFNACHERKMSDSYLIAAEGAPIGYGSVKGAEQLSDRDAIFEFYVLPPYRSKAHLFFPKLLEASGAAFIQCQSNERLLTSMLYQFGRDIRAEAILFEDDAAAGLRIPDAEFRPRREDDAVFEHKLEPVGEFVLASRGEIVATGGYLQHYNKPYADLYMEVKENARLQGFGSYFVQRLKERCYSAGRVPAARCGISNAASRATLLKAGFRICGFVLQGRLR
ncbi:N-acetyltransferase [Paenibacillus sp. IB182493]|uniref:N-acetyltransferase n=2 Tax=Paenibacillus arenilitoris TaxID=2772299 RepID=A0A927H3G8_9BACL|nr:N-acetyltransferase [Paenibacillus arenilitoris]